MRISHEEFAAQRNLDPILLKDSLREIRNKLFKFREERVHPAKDDKVIAAWNGLMIYTFAEAGRDFNRLDYLDAAQKAAQFIRTNLWKDGILLRRWREADARFDACLDDYACVIQGLISLFEADRGTEWLEFALTLTDVLKNDFKAEHGAFYLTNGKDPNIILRRCEFYDGAEPSGNAVHAENLLRLFQITGYDEYFKEAEDILKAAKEHIDLYPPGVCYHLMDLLRYYDAKAPTIVVALNEQEESLAEIKKMLASRFIPHKAFIWKRDRDEELRDLVPISRNKPTINDKTTLYICYRDHCDEPVTEISKMWEVIEKL